MDNLRAVPHPTIVEVDGVSIEYVLAPRMVVCSHGFGVRRDSLGMFTDIAASLPAGMGYVLFDYYEINGDMVRITDFTEQVAKLKSVLRWVYAQAGVKRVDLIGHSMGAIVVSLAMPVGVDTIILLAPPLSIGENTRNYFMNRAGVQKGDKNILVPRRDGTTSIIPYRLFDEFESIDAQKAIESLAAVHPLTIIEALREEILVGIDYSKLKTKPGVTLKALPADHNFSGSARPLLIKELRRILTGPPTA